MKPTLTKKIGLVLLLPLAGSLVSMFALNSLLNKTRVYFHSLGIASQQSMLAAQIPDWMHLVELGHEEDRTGLQSRIEGFDQALVVLQKGGQTAKEGREGSQPTHECQPCHARSAATIGPAPLAVQPDLALVASRWDEIRRDLLTLAETSKDDSRFVEAYRRVEGRLPELQNLSQRVVMALAAEYHRQYDRLLWTLILVAAASGAVFLASLLLTRRYVARDLAEHKQAAIGLTHLNRQNELILSSVAEGILGLDLQGNHTFVNPVAAKMLGYEPEELIGRPSHNLWHHTKPDGTPYPMEECAIYAAYRNGAVHRVSSDLFWRKDGASFPVEYASTPIYEQGRLAGAVLTFSDITERKREAAERSKLEDLLRSAQKMEAIGRLTGGIAHDFNNLLGIINGYSELSLNDLKENDPLRENIKEIQGAGERAATLTRQLLAFSRKQILQPKVLNLNDIIDRMERMLRRLIGEDIDLAIFSEAGLGQVKTDPGQMEQVIMNLVVNARDAMPEGGKLTVETKNVALDRTDADWAPDVEEGRYVMMSISDTGTGMDAKTLEHIFEPFFTTKEKSKGTGLGLSTVHGIVKQSGGHISVYSEPEHGTSVKVYLPRVDDRAESSVSPDIPSGDLRGSETVLVVEDEERLRKLVCRVLREKGYTVLEASSGQEALQLSAAHKGPIHLLATDVVMPELSGRETADILSLKRPETRVLYMSGYTDEAIVRHGVLHEDVHFLQKPFSQEALARKVREVLDTRRDPKRR